jgi:hypothetical protein
MTISREDPRFWDARTLQRRLRKGQLSRKDLDKHLKGLPDVADKGQAPQLDTIDDDSDEDIDEGDDGSTVE